MSTGEEILRSFLTIAVVGLSPNPDRPSYRVTNYAKEAGLKVVMDRCMLKKHQKIT